MQQWRGRPKKLIAWARWRAGAGPELSGERLWSIDSTTAVTADYCRDCRKHGRCGGCPEPKLLRDAQPGVVAFLTCATQWSIGGLGTRTGLRYDSCIALLDRYLPRWQAEDASLWGSLTVTDLLEDLQVIETAMLGADAERAEAERAQQAAQRAHGVVR